MELPCEYKGFWCETMGDVLYVDADESGALDEVLAEVEAEEKGEEKK